MTQTFKVSYITVTKRIRAPYLGLVFVFQGEEYLYRLTVNSFSNTAQHALDLAEELAGSLNEDAQNAEANAA